MAENFISYHSTYTNSQTDMCNNNKYIDVICNFDTDKEALCLLLLPLMHITVAISVYLIYCVTVSITFVLVTYCTIDIYFRILTDILHYTIYST